MKEKLEKTKGITLIALVVTIVVLIILAGITIGTLTGDNSIINRARSSKELTERTALEEQIEAAIIVAEQKKRNPTLDDVIEEIEKIDTVTGVNRENGDVENIFGDPIKGKLDDYLGKTSGDEGDKPEPPKLATDVLITNPDAEDAASKSPYIMYNNILCRVLYDKNSQYGIQIITDESVGDVTLGVDDEYVTASDFNYTDVPVTTDNNFRKAAASYNNAVDTLNNKAKTYMDGKGIATDARCLGSIPTLNSNSNFQGDTSGMWSGTYDYLNTYKWNEKFKKDDTNYLEDEQQLNDLGLNVSSGYTWLASRYVGYYSSFTGFYVRYVGSSGRMDYRILCMVYSYNDPAPVSYDTSYGFRPVFLLSSNVVIIDGDGTSESPYILGI